MAANSASAPCAAASPSRKTEYVSWRAAWNRGAMYANKTGNGQPSMLNQGVFKNRANGLTNLWLGIDGVFGEDFSGDRLVGPLAYRSYIPCAFKLNIKDYDRNGS